MMKHQLIRIDDIENDQKGRDLENMIDQHSLPRSPLDQPGGNVQGDISSMTERSNADIAQIRAESMTDAVTPIIEHTEPERENNDQPAHGQLQETKVNTNNSSRSSDISDTDDVDTAGDKAGPGHDEVPDNI